QASSPSGSEGSGAAEAAEHTGSLARLVRQGATSIGSSFAIQLLNVVTGVITARALGPSGKGELTAILLWPALLSMLGGLGLTDAVVYFGAQMPRHEREVVGTGLFLALCQSLLVV